MLIKGQPVASEIRMQSAIRILVSAAALLATASCSVDASSVDERSIGNSFLTESVAVYSRSPVADHASSEPVDVTSAMPVTQKRQAFYGALLRLPNEELFCPAPRESNRIGESHD